jgi:hypothetical protein
MYSTTGLAVGLAIGVPTFVFITVVVAFWYRQKVKYKKDLEEHQDIDDYDEVNDLDLDNIINSPNDNHIKDFSTQDLKNQSEKNTDLEGIGSDESNDQPEVIIKHGSYSFRKKSKIMGLRMINQDSADDLKQPPSKNSIQKSASPERGISKQQSDHNYKAYYESMLPIFDGDDRSSSNVNDLNELNAPSTPLKNNKLRSGQTSSQSSMDLYKLLQEDSSMYPGTRIPSVMLIESPLRYTKIKSQSSSSLKTSINNHKDFESPQTQGRNSYISPFDTPPSGKRLDLNDAHDSLSIEDDAAFENIPQHTRNKSVEIYDHTLDTNEEADSPTHNSLTGTNLHRRLNSGDSRMIVEDDMAEETYNQSRREWLDSYRKM